VIDPDEPFRTIKVQPEVVPSSIEHSQGGSCLALRSRSKTGVVGPTINAEGCGTRRSYTFRDLVAVRAVANLRKAGVSLQAVRRIQAALRRFRGSDEDLRQGSLVIEIARRRGPNVALALTDAEVLSLLHSEGQVIARTVFAMEPVIDEVRARVAVIERKRQPQAAAM